MYRKIFPFLTLALVLLAPDQRAYAQGDPPDVPICEGPLCNPSVVFLTQIANVHLVLVWEASIQGQTADSTCFPCKDCGAFLSAKDTGGGSNFRFINAPAGAPQGIPTNGTPVRVTLNGPCTFLFADSVQFQASNGGPWVDTKSANLSCSDPCE